MNNILVSNCIYSPLVRGYFYIQGLLAIFISSTVTQVSAYLNLALIIIGSVLANNPSCKLRLVGGGEEGTKFLKELANQGINSLDRFKIESIYKKYVIIFDKIL